MGFKVLGLGLDLDLDLGSGSSSGFRSLGFKGSGLGFIG